MPETIVTQHQENFEKLRRAFTNRDACLLACQLRQTGEDVAVVCAVNQPVEGQYELVPFAMLFNGNPYELLLSPGEIDELNEGKETTCDEDSPAETS